MSSTASLHRVGCRPVPRDIIKLNGGQLKRSAEGVDNIFPEDVLREQIHHPLLRRWVGGERQRDRQVNLTRCVCLSIIPIYNSIILFSSLSSSTAYRCLLHLLVTSTVTYFASHPPTPPPPPLCGMYFVTHDIGQATGQTVSQSVRQSVSESIDECREEDATTRFLYRWTGQPAATRYIYLPIISR